MNEPTDTNPRSNRRRIAIVAIVAVVLAGLAATAFFWRPWETGHVHVEASTIYTCPMHPQIREPKPGKCPICFMALVPEAAGGDTSAASAALMVTPRDRVIADVRTVKVAFRSFSQTLQAPAGVDYNEATHKVVTARIAGRIERLHVDRTGEYVRAGAPLMEIYSPELISAQQEFLVAQKADPLDELPGATQQDKAARDARWRSILDAARTKLELLGMTDAQIDALARRRTVAPTLTLFAPSSGIVLRRATSEGAYVSVGTMLLELVDVSSVWIIANVSENEAWRVREGMLMSATGPALGGETVHGRVDYIYPAVDAASRSVRVRGTFGNRGTLLKPGMYLTSTILVPRSDALAVPVDAVIRTGARDIVYVEIDKNTFEAREVKLGARQGEYYEIAGGKIGAGDNVVAQGSYLIDSEMRLKSGG